MIAEKAHIGLLEYRISKTRAVSYRFGFNGHENDNEIKGTGNYLAFGDYGYDTRLGRRWNIDPVVKPSQSGYSVFTNNPIFRFDPDGRTDYKATVRSSKDQSSGVIKKTVDVQIVYQVINLSSSLNYVTNPEVIPGHNSGNFSTSFTTTNALGEKVDMTVNVQVQFEVITDFSKINNNKNVLFLVDKINTDPADHLKRDPIGLAKFDGQVASVEAGKGFTKHTILHELGHNLGFKFTNNPDKKDQLHSPDPNHLMYKAGSDNNINLTDLKSIWKPLANFNDGTYQMGEGSAKQQAKEFINNGLHETNQTKKTATKTP